MTQATEIDAAAAARTAVRTNAMKAIHQLQRTGRPYALVAICIGGGQGIAAVYERA